MRYLPDGAWMQRADEYTIQKIGIPSLVLMERAALKTVEVMKEKGITVLLCAEVEIMVEMDSPLQDFFIWREKMCVRFLQGKKHP